MPVEIVTNVVAAIGSLALLLEPQGVRPEAERRPDPAPEISATLLGDWGGLRPRCHAHGIDFTVQYIGEVAGNVTGGARQGTVYNGLVNVGTDLDLAALAGWPGGTFHAALLFPHGRSLTQRYVNDLFTLSNLDASDDLHLFELWLEQHFFAEQWSLRVGQLAVDQEFAYTEQGALFANATYGWFAIAGNNVIAPVYPQGAPAVRLRWRPAEKFFVQAAVTDGDVNPTDASGRETNPHGLKVRLDEGAFVIGEVGWQWVLDHGTKPGTVKLGGWYHTARTARLRWDDGGLSLADPLSSGNPATRGGNHGLYCVIEQVMWRENPADNESSEGVGLFGRAGWAPPDRNPLGWYLEGGVTQTGLLPGRDADVCGLALAYGRMSSAARGRGADDNFFNATANALPDYELVVAADYQLQLGPGAVLQPGAQYLIHPGGEATWDDALVLSLRMIIDF